MGVAIGVGEDDIDDVAIRFVRQIKRPPIVKGGSPAKKRHMSSPPPFARHLKYSPKSGSPPNPSRCGTTPPLPSDRKRTKTLFPGYLPMVGPSAAAALNPGMFTSHLQFQVGKT